MATEKRRQSFREWAKVAPYTPISPAFLTGPTREQEERARERAERGLVGVSQIAEGEFPRPTPSAEQLFEIGSAVAGAIPGGFATTRVAAPLALKIGRPLARKAFVKGTEIAGRMLGGGAGGGAASELLAPREETPEEASARRQEALALGAGGELVGAGLELATTPIARAIVAVAKKIPVVRRLVDPLQATRRGTLERGVEEAQEILAEGGLSLTPGQAIDSFALDTAENVAESAIFGGQIVRGRRRKAEEYAIGRLDDFIAKLTERTGKQEAGALVKIALDGSAKIHRHTTKGAYRRVTRLLKARGENPIPVDIRQVKSLLERRFGKRASVDPQLGKALKQITDKGDFISFEDAHEIRSIMLEISRGSSDILPETYPAFGSAASRLLDRRMRLAAQRLAPEVYAQWRKAAALSRLGHETFNDGVIRGLLKKQTPEDAWRYLSQANRPTRLQELREVVYDPSYRKVIGDPDAFWQRLQGQFLQDLKTISREGEFTNVSGRMFRERLERAGETLEALFPNVEQRRRALALARTIELTQAKAGASRSGSVVIQLAQAGAIISLATQFPQEAGSAAPVGILLAPPAIAAIITRKGVADFLIRGATGRGLGRVSGSFLGQLVSRLTKANIPFEIVDARTGGPLQ